MNPRIAVIALWAPDVAVAAQFYGKTLGLAPLPHHDLPHFKLEGAILALLPGQPRPPREDKPSHFPIFALAVLSLDDYLAPLQRAGVEPLFGVEENAQTRFVRFYDPGGNLIELVELE